MEALDRLALDEDLAYRNDGVRPQPELDLVARGHDVLVASPFGPDWYR